MRLREMKNFSLKYIALIFFLSSTLTTNGAETETPLAPKTSNIEVLLNKLPKAESSLKATAIRNKIWQELMNGYSSDTVGEKLNKAMHYFYSNQLNDAEKAFGEIIALEPDFVEAWNKRATVRYLQGNFLGSMLDINQVLERQSRHFGALSGSGLIYLKLEMPKRALESYLSVSEIDPWNEETKKLILKLKELVYGIKL